MEKHKIDIRLLFWMTLVVMISFVIFASFDLIFTERYKFDTNHIPFTWIVFWTHLSNISALIWIICLLTARFGKFEKFDDALNKWTIKNLVFTFIIFTGTVFMALVYIPTVRNYLNPDFLLQNDDGLFYSPGIAYRYMVIFGTTLKHFVIPSIFVILFLIEPWYTTEKNIMKNRDKSMALLIFPSLWFVASILLTSLGVPTPSETIDFVNMENEYALIMFYLFVDVIAGMFFILLSRIQFHFADLNEKKLKEKIPSI